MRNIGSHTKPVAKLNNQSPLLPADTCGSVLTCVGRGLQVNNALGPDNVCACRQKSGVLEMMEKMMINAHAENSEGGRGPRL